MRGIFDRNHSLQPTHTMVDEALVQQAVAAATEVRRHAYAPYSAFNVGACVVDSQGNVYHGCNVENASYGLTQCAERAAVTAATAAGNRDIVLCAIVTEAAEPTAPCGACRQVLSECNPSMLIVSLTTTGSEKRWTLSQLLPDALGPSNLGSTR